MVFLELLKDVAEGHVEMKYREVPDAEEDGKPKLKDGKPVMKLAPARGVDGKPMPLRTTVRRNPNWFPAQKVKTPAGEVAVECPEPKFFVTEFKKGVVISAHPEAAKKYVDRGLAKVVPAPAGE